MGRVTYQTYAASGHLIEQMRATGVIKEMLHDGGDIILFDSYVGDLISVHMIDSGIPLYEVKSIMKANEEKGIYTMFMLWTSMMLPEHGQRYLAEDWMEALYTLNDGLIYGYDVANAEVFVFPVYFKGETRVRTVEYGTTIRTRQLKTRRVKTAIPDFIDEWLIADFEGDQAQMRPEAAGEFATYYALLGVVPGDDAETIKQAYRILARRYHPDTNPDADANQQMQRINEAYKKLVDAL